MHLIVLGKWMNSVRERLHHAFLWIEIACDTYHIIIHKMILWACIHASAFVVKLIGASGAVGGSP